MDFVSKTHEALSPQTLYSSPPFHHYSSNEPGFPIIAIAIIGILATAFVLVTYYILVIKCCLNIHSSNSNNNNHNNNTNHHHQDHQSLLIITSSEDRNHRGLDDSVIRSIPVYRYRRNDTKNTLKDENNNSKECAVCLAEFQDDEKLRVIPICGHLFHIDCIDVWLQGNANCPLCRTSVPNAIRLVERIVAPSPSPVGYYDYNSRLLDHQTLVEERPNKIGKGASMGDECIEIGRDKDKRLWVDQPIRRSFSMDSSGDRKMLMAIQEAVGQVRSVSNSNSNGNGNGNDVEASGSSGNRSVIRKSFFSFGSSRSNSAVLPVYLDEP